MISLLSNQAPEGSEVPTVDGQSYGEQEAEEPAVRRRIMLAIALKKQKIINKK